ncbi:MAG: hypothetical protein KDD11_16755, partial [Acidobacteria bacterium]|nr:hypothetical protein [Acidobacteriota bacterium]
SMADTWKHPFVYRCWNETGGSGCDTFRIASPGTDGVLSDPSLESYETGSWQLGEELDRDIVFGPGGAVQAPAR